MKNRKLFWGTSLMVVTTVMAFAQQYNPESDFRAKPIDGGKGVEIIEYVGTKWAVNIPPTIQGLPVTYIGDNSFQGKNLISIIIPKSVISIGNEAFKNNQLTSITIPDGFIGTDAFSQNDQLISITIGKYAIKNPIDPDEFRRLIRDGETTFYNGGPDLTEVFATFFWDNYWAKYNGAAGTYIRSDINSNTWTKKK